MLIDNGLEILDENPCRQLLAGGSIGRVAVTVGCLPVVFPVNYRMIDDAIVFRTAKGTKLGAATAGAVVAFEVDGGLDPQYREGWSVLCVGRAEAVVDAARLERLRGALPEPWAPGTRDDVIRIGLELVTGRRIARHAGTSTAGPTG